MKYEGIRWKGLLSVECSSLSIPIFKKITSCIQILAFRFCLPFLDCTIYLFSVSFFCEEAPFICFLKWNLCRIQSQHVTKVKIRAKLIGLRLHYPSGTWVQSCNRDQWTDSPKCLECSVPFCWNTQTALANRNKKLSVRLCLEFKKISLIYTNVLPYQSSAWILLCFIDTVYTTTRISIELIEQLLINLTFAKDFSALTPVTRDSKSGLL